MGRERQDPVPGQGSDHHRQRHSAGLVRWPQRQGRPERAGRRGSVGAARRRAGGGRHGLNPGTAAVTKRQPARPRTRPRRCRAYQRHSPRWGRVALQAGVTPLLSTAAEPGDVDEDAGRPRANLRQPAQTSPVLARQTTALARWRSPAIRTADRSSSATPGWR